MVPYKAVFIDLDGTLLNKQSIVSARNAATLKKLVDRDIRVVFATGRPIESVRNLVGKIHDKDPAITLSGSMIHASVYGAPMMAHTIPFDTFQQILAACEAMGTVDNILVDDADGFYVLKHSKEMEEFVGMFNAEPQLFTYDAIPTSPILSLMIHSKEHRA
ncbi:MAG: HAD-IIB family hydrolase [Proteobacteria bacterium]|nr:MAG: HAD-IIB family hydrolase [Pseudomonadota bacterium]